MNPKKINTNNESVIRERERERKRDETILDISELVTHVLFTCMFRVIVCI